MSHHHPHRRSRVGIMPLLLLGGAVYALTRPRKTSTNGDSAREGDNRAAQRAGSGSDAMDGTSGEVTPARQANEELQRNARKAMRMKEDSDRAAPHIPESRTAHDGMHNNPNRDVARSGALEADGFRPGMGRGGMAR